MIRILSIFGTRPEAIKVAPVLDVLARRSGAFESLVCLTGQHRDMLDSAIAGFALSPDYDLDLMKHGQSPSEVAGSALQVLPAVFEDARPDLVLVQGDTTTTIASAFAAFLAGVPVGHIEAGLRTGDYTQPFPEEMNRVLTSRIATLHFAPTATAEAALLAEGVPESKIIHTGNTVVDALLEQVERPVRYTSRQLRARDPDRPLILVTSHRRESIGEPLERICSAVSRLATLLPEHDFVFPIHPNPDVRGIIDASLRRGDNVLRIDPVPYTEFAHLMASARLILTDSGGVQEEAPALDVPVLVMRETTERPEGLAAGTARLVGTDPERIIGDVR
ncbi:MAG: UDP-N-acetylglucosamine 2-epimerase (non-hydrolyzing), partial [Gemmatimonadetes bacterium]|nr:UDP-N-acetylglucosamine 2-epimerase (non-hydrolyzing) [Gemmatimonadota bacterium]